MDFSAALNAIKAGQALTHPTLDGFVSMTPGAHVPSDKIWSPQNRSAAQIHEQKTGRWMRVAPSITRCYPHGEGVIVMGWQPTQEDMFAENWEIWVA